MITRVNEALQRRRRGEKGFSLIELLVTVAIIAILAAVAIPVYANQRNKAYLATAQQDGRALSMEIASAMSYYTTYGTATAASTTFIPVTAAGFTSVTLTLTGTPSPSTPLTQSLTSLRPSTGTSITSSGNSSTDWCVAVDNGGQKAVYTSAGLQVGKTACTGVGAATS